MSESLTANSLTQLAAINVADSLELKTCRGDNLA
jgi:hypothetical protein